MIKLLTTSTVLFQRGEFASSPTDRLYLYLLIKDILKPFEF